MPRRPEELVRDAYGLAQRGDLGGAERLCREALAAEPRHLEALGLSGMLRLALGDAVGAERVLSDALAANPDHPGLIEQLGLACLATRDFARAEQLLKRLLAFGAEHALVYMRLGLALSGQGRSEEAVGFLRVAAAKSPGDPDVLLNLGNVLAEAGQSDAALGAWREILSRHPGHALTLFNVGTMCRAIGRFEEALDALAKARAAAPRDVSILVNLSLTQEDLGRLDEASATLQAAAMLAPRHPGVLNGLGSVALRQGRLAEAAGHFESALAVQPDYGDALINLGILRSEQGRIEEAAAAFDRARQAAPRSAAPLFHLGRLARRSGRAAEAIGILGGALDMKGMRLAVLIELAGAHRDAGDVAAAVRRYREAIDADLADPVAAYNLAELHAQHAELEAAAVLYGEALRRKPQHLRSLAGLIHVRQHQCAWDGIELLWERLRQGLAAAPDTPVSPFNLLSMPTTAAEQLVAARAWARVEMAGRGAARTADRPAGAASGRQRLRIGYLSSGFRRHAVAHLTAELFELHDPDGFEAHAYSSGIDDGSPVRARIREAAAGFVDVSSLSTAALADRITADGIDILVDLDGYTQGTRNAVMALRPAPVQVNWLGYPGTLGADCVDYIVADRHVIPEDADGHYAERVVRLPVCYQITDRRREVAAAPPSRASVGLPAEAVVLCCFNQSYKLLPETFALWMRVLRAVPSAVLWLAESNAWATENLRRTAAAAGIDPVRLVFAPRRPLAEHLARYRAADLAIDTFPYTSHTTASDALWMGCPLVTRMGETFAARVAGSIVIHAGMPDLVARDQAGYERLVIELARSPERLRDLRRRLESGRDTSPLFDVPRFVSALEDAYRSMVPVAGAAGHGE